MNEKYRIAARKSHKEVKLEPGDLVWLHLRKERFLELRKSKLISRVAGPFKILAKMNDNAYKLELPPEFGVSPSFNISDSRPYMREEDEMPSRTTSIQEGEDDEDINKLLLRTSIFQIIYQNSHLTLISWFYKILWSHTLLFLNDRWLVPTATHARAPVVYPSVSWHLGMCHSLKSTSPMYHKRHH
jgi:hypothetical protein